MRYAKTVEKHFTVTQRGGTEWLVMCPWHDDTSQGHLYVNVRKGVFLCMSCGAKGHLDRLDGVDLPQVSTSDVRDRLRALQAPRNVQKTYPEAWLAQYDVPHDYWTQTRGLPDDVVRQFRLGYDPFSNRLTLPLRDMHGRVLGVTYRRLDDGTPKYLHPKGFPIGRHLYGAWLLTDQRKVALVEGQVDAIRCWSERVPALSMMGSRLTRDQVKVLQRSNIGHVVLMLDNDKAGLKGTLGVYEALRGSGIRVSCGWYRDYWFGVKDPDGLTGQRLRKMYHSSVPVDVWADLSGAKEVLAG